MDGSDEVPSGGRQDVDMEVKLPTQIVGGLEHRFTERLHVMASLRWTDSSTFGSSRANFGAMPTVRPAFVPAAKDEWRAAIGTRYAWTPRVELRAGFAYSTRIVGTDGASALLFDNNHVAMAVGGAYARGDWTFEFTAGLIPFADRDVNANEAIVFPGNYQSGGGMLMLGMQRRF